jgi:hypothetical protein
MSGGDNPPRLDFRAYELSVEEHDISFDVDNFLATVICLSTLRGLRMPYLLAYKSPLCGPCETDDSLGGTYSKGIYYVDGLCAIQILLGRDSDPSPGGDLYAGGLVGKWDLYASRCGTLLSSLCP